MEFDYISFLKDLYKLKLYLLKHEKASTIDELSDYLSLALMTRDRFGINIEEELKKWFSVQRISSQKLG